MHYATSIKENKELSETFDLFHEYHSEIQFHFQLICFYSSDDFSYFQYAVS